MHAQKDASSETARELRRRGGQFLRQVRIDAGLTQLDIAKAIGTPYVSFISQLERGIGRPPPQSYGPYAEALGLDPVEFTTTMLRYYDPWVWKWLGGSPTLATGKGGSRDPLLTDGTKVAPIGGFKTPGDWGGETDIPVEALNDH